MTYAVDFETVWTVGLESSPVAAALAGLRANEARYFKNKYAGRSGACIVRTGERRARSGLAAMSCEHHPCGRRSNIAL
ncbi:hypothetical protein [Kitasatospora sp. NPDC085464]|uniref:hypothetical protein n=1 Tax=Kitasatospora sp. NPDC085464 TaxID=3364063 RepID=UPI0037CA6F5C